MVLHCFSKLNIGTKSTVKAADPVQQGVPCVLAVMVRLPTEVTGTVMFSLYEPL